MISDPSPPSGPAPRPLPAPPSCLPLPTRPLPQVLVILAFVLLLGFADAFRIASLYDPKFAGDDHYLYPLQILPELLELYGILLPGLLPRIGFAARYGYHDASTAPKPQGKESHGDGAAGAPDATAVDDSDGSGTGARAVVVASPREGQGAPAAPGGGKRVGFLLLPLIMSCVSAARGKWAARGQ